MKALLPLLLLMACSSGKPGESTSSLPPKTTGPKIGLVTDVGGRGDESFNDGALRGLETWASGVRYSPKGYEALGSSEIEASVPEDLRVSHPVRSLSVKPIVLQARQQEDYEPNLQVLVDDGVELAIGVGFMLENAVEATAKRNPSSRFLLIDSPMLDPEGKPYTLPNVRTVTFREQEGTFLAGAVAGMVTRSDVVGFVGGMQIPLIRRFESGFRAGLMTTNPQAGGKILVGYTGSFDRIEAGKQVGQDMVSKNADVIFQAAGSDGLGAIAAAAEAGRWAIGCDGDQHHVAPQAIITSMIKHVDYAVYNSINDVASQKFTGGHTDLGLKEGGLGMAPFRNERVPDRERILATVEQLRQLVVSGSVKVPSTLDELSTFQPPVLPPAQ